MSTTTTTRRSDRRFGEIVAQIAVVAVTLAIGTACSLVPLFTTDDDVPSGLMYCFAIMFAAFSLALGIMTAIDCADTREACHMAWRERAAYWEANRDAADAIRSRDNSIDTMDLMIVELLAKVADRDRTIGNLRGELIEIHHENLSLRDTIAGGDPNMRDMYNL